MLTGCFSNEPVSTDFENAFINMIKKGNPLAARQMFDNMDMKTVVHAQDNTGSNIDPLFSSRITITLTPSVQLYKYIKRDSEGNPLVKKVDNSGAALILSGISKSKLVNEKWVPDITKLDRVKTEKEIIGHPLTNWRSPIVID
jgi:hypothetical protein